MQQWQSEAERNEDLSQEPQEEEKVMQKAQAHGPSWAANPSPPSPQTQRHSPKGIRLLWPTLEPPEITLLRS